MERLTKSYKQSDGHIHYEPCEEGFLYRVAMFQKLGKLEDLEEQSWSLYFNWHQNNNVL